MVKTLTKHGNSYALVIDKAIMELLKIQPDTPLELTTNGDKLIITPVRSESRQEKLDRVIEEVNRKFGPAFKKLAE